MASVKEVLQKLQEDKIHKGMEVKKNSLPEYNCISAVKSGQRHEDYGKEKMHVFETKCPR